MLISDAIFCRLLLAWYDSHKRDLPWRTTRHRNDRPDPYHVLVSETMLQQTQVATVIPYFHRFIARFPTLKALASADEQDVLRLWQGLGYYSRARNLHATAKIVVSRLAGRIPCTVEQLLALPGIGRYTAGAVASIAFNTQAPIVDGNIMRVLCRLEKIESDPRTTVIGRQLWKRAEELVPTARAGDFNSAMMELGSTICTPRAPKCLVCPVRTACRAQAAGLAERIPPAAKPIKRARHRRWTFAIEREGKFLIEQRPAQGRWASLWQFVTLEAQRRRPTAQDVLGATGLSVDDVRHIGRIEHALTHLDYEFTLYLARCSIRQPCTGNGRVWVAPAELENYPLPRPHLRMAQMLVELT